jgi:peptide/nickel transport system permease protein
MTDAPRLSIGVLGVLLTLAVVAPWLAPYDPAAQLDLIALKNHAPTSAHWLGTDAFSRDVLSRALFGARTTVSVAIVASLTALATGATWAAAALLLGPRWGRLLLTVADVLRSVPRLLLLLAIVVVVNTLPPLILALAVGVTASPSVCRIVHTQLLRLRARPYVEAASALGVSTARVMSRHLAPHLVGPLVAVGVLLLADVMAFEAAVSFLGLGVRPPAVSWGSMMQDALPFLGTAWWGAMVPATCLALTVLCTARIADHLDLARDQRHD